MAGHSSREVEQILMALSLLVSTKQHRPVVVRRAATPTRKTPIEALRRKGEETVQSLSASPLKQSVRKRLESGRMSEHESEAHPFTNMKIRMLINLHNSMQEGDSLPEKDTVKLPRLTELRPNSLSSGQKP